MSLLISVTAGMDQWSLVSSWLQLELSSSASRRPTPYIKMSSAKKNIFVRDSGVLVIEDGLGGGCVCVCAQPCANSRLLWHSISLLNIELKLHSSSPSQVGVKGHHTSPGDFRHFYFMSSLNCMFYVLMMILTCSENSFRLRKTSPVSGLCIGNAFLFCLQELKDSVQKGLTIKLI